MDILHYFPHKLEWTVKNSTCTTTFRENGPCVIYSGGYIFFSQIDPLGFNRKKGPAKISPTGEIEYTLAFACGTVRHRTDGPAVILADGSKEYWVTNIQIPVEEFFVKYGVV